MKILYYLKKYPISISVVLVVIYLSFFRPPSLSVGRIPHFDKVVHFGMYFGLSAILWFEFLRNHRNRMAPVWHAWVGAMVCPILFSGLVEIMQEYCTSYRGGDWMDFLANTLGAVTAGLLMYYYGRHLLVKKGWI